MKLFLYVTLSFFLSFYCSAEPLLLKGFFNEGALVLQKADAQFLKLVEDMLARSEQNLATGSLKHLAEAVINTMAQAQNAAAASILFAPITETDPSILMNPILLSESVLQDLGDTGRSVLKVMLPGENENTSESALSTTSLAQLWDTIGGLGIPIETGSLRSAVKQTIENFPAEAFSLRAAVLRAVKSMASPLALLESDKSGEDMLRDTISKFVPVQFGPLIALKLEN